MRVIRRFSRWFDQRPLAAVYAGILFCFALMECVAALLKH